jgi:hypothetical protein
VTTAWCAPADCAHFVQARPYIQVRTALQVANFTGEGKLGIEIQPRPDPSGRTQLVLRAIEPRILATSPGLLVGMLVQKINGRQLSRVGPKLDMADVISRVSVRPVSFAFVLGAKVPAAPTPREPSSRLSASKYR